MEAGFITCAACNCTKVTCQVRTHTHAQPQQLTHTHSHRESLAHAQQMQFAALQLQNICENVPGARVSLSLCSVRVCVWECVCVSALKTVPS